MAAMQKSQHIHNLEYEKGWEKNEKQKLLLHVKKIIRKAAKCSKLGSCTWG